MNFKQRAFVEEYLQCWNASEAARRAGYKGDPNTIGPRLLVNVGIRAIIENRLEEKAMRADEVLARMAEQARGEHGKYLREDGSVDFARLIADDKAHLVKSVKITKYGLEVEFYDAQTALVHIGKDLGRFKDQHEHSGKLRVLVEYTDGPAGAAPPPSGATESQE